jgi:hypothetical protein
MDGMGSVVEQLVSVPVPARLDTEALTEAFETTLSLLPLFTTTTWMGASVKVVEALPPGVRLELDEGTGWPSIGLPLLIPPALSVPQEPATAV